MYTHTHTLREHHERTIDRLTKLVLVGASLDYVGLVVDLFWFSFRSWLTCCVGTQNRHLYLLTCLYRRSCISNESQRTKSPPWLPIPTVRSVIRQLYLPTQLFPRPMSPFSDHLSSWHEHSETDTRFDVAQARSMCRKSRTCCRCCRQRKGKTKKVAGRSYPLYTCPYFSDTWYPVRMSFLFIYPYGDDNGRE